MKSFRYRIMAQALPFLLIAPGLAWAQMPPSRGEAAAALNQPGNPGAAQFTRQQIDQMVAPIALYPDQLLTQVLMASTYPQQIADAAQWLQDPQNGSLKGDALAAALQPLPWDPSVKALVPFPQIVAMMAEHIDWTQALGVAFATQQPEVMIRVQALRQLAMKSGRLKQLRHLTVREEGGEIVVASAEPDRIFVPVYNPTVVYGAWPDPGFQPVYLPPPRGFVAETIEPGLDVSVGYGVVRPLWGWSRPDWRSHQITINRTDYTRITNNVRIAGDTWRHDGPVVLAAPAAARPRAAAANLPAGTIDPGRAAAVTALPQRAARDPQRIQTQATTAAPATPTTTAQPGTTQPASTATTPNAAQQGQAGPSPTKPGTTQTGQAAPGTATPNAAQRGAAGTTAAAPNVPPTGQTHAGTGVAEPQRQGAATRHPAGQPGSPATAERQPKAEQQGVAGTSHEPAAANPAQRQPSAAERRNMPVNEGSALNRAEQHSGRGQAATTTSSAASHGTTPPAAQGNAAARPQATPQVAAPAHPAPQAAPHPAAQATPHQPGQPLPRETAGQGSSAAPGATAPHAGAGRQGPEAAGGHAAAKPDEGKKNEPDGKKTEP